MCKLNNSIKFKWYYEDWLIKLPFGKTILKIDIQKRDKNC